MSRNSNLPKIILAFAAIYIIWGTTYLAIRVAVSTMPPFLMAGARFIVAGTVMFLVLRLRGQPMPRRLHWRSAFIVGGFLLVGGNGFVTWAEQEVPSGIAALIVATVPLWMTVFDWSLFKGPRPTRRITFGVFLGLFGIALLVGPSLFDEAGGVGLASWTIMILAPLLWSIGSLLSRSADMPPNILMSTAIEMLAGGALLLLLGLVTGESSQLDINLFTAQSWAAFLYLIVFGSIVAFTAYIYLLQHVQATRVGTYSYVNPIIAVFLGWLILGEPLSARMLVAAAVIVVAVMLIIRQRGQIAQDQEQPGPAGAPALGSQPVAAGPEND